MAEGAKETKPASGRQEGISGEPKPANVFQLQCAQPACGRWREGFGERLSALELQTAEQGDDCFGCGGFGCGRSCTMEMIIL